MFHRWDASLKWDKTTLIALVFLWFLQLFLSCFIAHTQSQRDIGVLACFKPVFFFLRKACERYCIRAIALRPKITNNSPIKKRVYC